MSDLKRELESLRLDTDDAPPRRRGLWIGATLLVLLAGIAAGLYFMRARLSAVEVETVRATRLESASGNAATALLTASGYLVARREAVVSAKIQGRLAELRVEEGDRVQEGDIIARLESDDFQAQVARARAQVTQVDAQNARALAAVQRAEADLAEFRRQYRQNERLAQDKIVAQDALDAAASRVKVGEAALEQARAEIGQVAADRERVAAELRFAEAQLANTVIRAPFAGTVVRKMAEVGESVAPIPPGVNLSTSSGAVVALADLATLEMEADVSEANVARLQEKQPAEVEVEAFPDARYKAVLRQIIPTADRTKATVQVKVTLLDKDDRLKPEMSAKVTFMSKPDADATASRAVTPAPAPQVLVPQSAVVTRNGTSRVFEIVDGAIKARDVVTAGTRRSDVLVSKGLIGGETLVSNPPDAMQDGVRVRVRGT